ncbi:L-seryl-tRNA selenium transferase [Halorubrum sp. DTA98]|uniref:L-seryl-tRNA selenium transferase n=1 Tax=Halorubrum sp. DTA98 TaxID=3402163 RepID=UPI003AAE280E
MTEEPGIYDELDVPTVINGVGTRSQVSGATVRPEAREAMSDAATESVYVSDLQAAASKVIRTVTGAEAGLITAGAASGLALASAACLAGDDYGVMERLPDTDGVPSEIIIPRSHRCKYQISLRASGAELVGVGPVSHHPVNGGTDRVEQWHLEAAVTEDTAAIAYLSRPYNVLSIESAAEVAHEHEIPLIVDAADDVHPPERMRSLFEKGADLVSFSGGKSIGGPQSTGILAGNADLVRSAALQMLPDGYDDRVWSPPQEYIDPDQLNGVPPNGIGRPMKVSKEEIVGIITALERFHAEDHAQRLSELRSRSERIVDRLDPIEGIDAHLSHEFERYPPKVVVSMDPAVVGDAATVVRKLRNENPRVWIGDRRLHRNETTISPKCLTDDEADYLVDRFSHYVGN